MNIDKAVGPQLRRRLRASLLLGVLSALANGASPVWAAEVTIKVPLDEIGRYERELFDRSVTRCDLLTAHPDDPEAVAEGVSRDAMDKPAAIEACTLAVGVDPDNPRLRYQLGRAHGYSGQHAQAIPHREIALRAGYPQSLFVMGYIRLTGWDGAEPDRCYGGELILRSARLGRMAGLVGYPHYFLLGRFADCEDYPVSSTTEMLNFLTEADRLTTDFYQRALISQLRASLSKD